MIGVLGCINAVLLMTSEIYSKKLIWLSLHEQASESNMAARWAPLCDPKKSEFLLESDMYIEDDGS